MFLVDSSSIELTKSNSKLLADDSSSQNETRGGHFVFCSPRPPGGWEKSAHVKNQKSIPIPIHMQKIKECVFFAQLLHVPFHLMNKGIGGLFQELGGGRGSIFFWQI